MKWWQQGTKCISLFCQMKVSNRVKKKTNKKPLRGKHNWTSLWHESSVAMCRWNSYPTAEIKYLCNQIKRRVKAVWKLIQHMLYISQTFSTIQRQPAQACQTNKHYVLHGLVLWEQQCSIYVAFSNHHLTVALQIHLLQFKLSQQRCLMSFMKSCNAVTHNTEQ